MPPPDGPGPGGPTEPQHATPPTTPIRVRLGPSLRPSAGHAFLDIHLPPDAPAGELRRQIVAARPRLAGLVGAALVVAGDRVLADDAPVPRGVEVALLVPVAGGRP